MSARSNSGRHDCWVFKYLRRATQAHQVSMRRHATDQNGFLTRQDNWVWLQYCGLLCSPELFSFNFTSAYSMCAYSHTCKHCTRVSKCLFIAHKLKEGYNFIKICQLWLFSIKALLRRRKKKKSATHTELFFADDNWKTHISKESHLIHCWVTWFYTAPTD